MRFEKERQRSAGGKKGVMRALSASMSDSDVNDDTDMDDESIRAQELGAAAPAARGDKEYLEREKERRERATSKAKGESYIKSERQRGEEEESRGAGGSEDR